MSDLQRLFWWQIDEIQNYKNQRRSLGREFGSRRRYIENTNGISGHRADLPLAVLLSKGDKTGDDVAINGFVRHVQPNVAIGQALGL